MRLVKVMVGNIARNGGRNQSFYALMLRQALTDVGCAVCHGRHVQGLQVPCSRRYGVYLGLRAPGFGASSYTNYSKSGQICAAVPLGQASGLVLTDQQIQTGGRPLTVQRLQRVNGVARAVAFNFARVYGDLWQVAKSQCAHGQAVRGGRQRWCFVGRSPGRHDVQALQTPLRDGRARQGNMAQMRRVKRTAKHANAHSVLVQTQSRATR